ncbi:glycoside hydrolase family 13 protein [Deinococcus misasensis]|uniref:glycoside hydrolase family 13 protein n=1 Tax=Deinococcus misasensis TaxID=392413 RepID=UPI0005520068|nr:glycoside hydrolase family 13 protein [Deinococcus misasensis]
MSKSVHTPDWVKDAVFYQIYPDRFAKSSRVQKANNLQPWGDTPHPHKYQGGDLLGVVEHLDHLVELGVNAIYFCPIFQSASNHRYHTHDYFQVDPMLGGNEALKELLEEAHKRGIKVVLDGVFNHSSRGFFQFNDVLENGPSSAYVDWFHIHGWPLDPYGSGPANYEAWWGMKALPKFNTNTRAVREFLWDVAEYWIKFGVDGWRLDVPNEIDDDEFWREFRRRVKTVNPEAYIVGEIWGDATRWLQGDQFDAVMNYLFTRPAIGFFGSRSLDYEQVRGTGYEHIDTMDAPAFAGHMQHILTMYPKEVVLAQLNLLGSHDTPRYRTVTGGDETAYQMAVLFQMTYPGTPCIYYGDEVGLSGGKDPLCRGAFPWDRPDTWNLRALDYTKKVVKARHTYNALRRGDFRVLHAQGDVIVYERTQDGERAVVVINASQSEQQVPVDLNGEVLEVLGDVKLNLSGSITVPARTGYLLV